MPDVRIGTVDIPDRLGWDRYFKKLRFLESSVLVAGPTKPGTLGKWKAQIPTRAIALTAPWVVTQKQWPKSTVRQWATDNGPGATVGELKDSPSSRAALVELTAAGDLLDAWGYVFPSPPLFAPSSTNRDRLKHFFAEIFPAEAAGDRARVWIPDGLWEPVAAVRFANELGVRCAIDPLIKNLEYRPDVFFELDTDDAYFRIEGTGRHGPMRGDTLDALAELCLHYPSATVALATTNRLRDATTLRKEVAAAAALAGDAPDAADAALDDDDGDGDESDADTETN